MANANEPRVFPVGKPVIRISNSSTNAIERIIMIDELDNEYGPPQDDWFERHESPITEVQSGKLYSHIDGFRLNATIQFSYWHQGYSANPVQGQTFTEHDYKWLKLAQNGTAHNIEFFPYDTLPMGTPPNSYYHCLIPDGGLRRAHPDGNVYLWQVTLTVVGVNRVTTLPVI